MRPARGNILKEETFSKSVILVKLVKTSVRLEVGETTVETVYIHTIWYEDAAL